MKYNYKIYFKFKNDINRRYVMSFSFEAQSNEEAKMQGATRWGDQVATRERLKEAEVIKTICRKQETKPRAPRLSPMQRALSALNAYIAEDLAKESK